MPGSVKVGPGKREIVAQLRRRRAQKAIVPAAINPRTSVEGSGVWQVDGPGFGGGTGLGPGCGPGSGRGGGGSGGTGSGSGSGGSEVAGGTQAQASWEHQPAVPISIMYATSSKALHFPRMVTSPSQGCRRFGSA